MSVDPQTSKRMSTGLVLSVVMAAILLASIVVVMSSPQDVTSHTTGQSSTTDLEAATLNNRYPNLVPKAGTLWRGSTAGNLNASASVYNAKYGVPLHLWRTFTWDLSPEVTAFVKQGGILWVNGAKKDTWKEIAAGKKDAKIKSLADQVAALKPALVYVCPWHEADHNVGHGEGMEADDFKKMWWHWQDLFAEHGADNAVWAMDYSVQTISGNGDNVPSLWPGDQHVDWLFFNVFERKKQLDKYNWDYTNITRIIYGKFEAMSTKQSAECELGCDFVSKPWGLGAYGSNNDNSEAERAAFYEEAKEKLDDLPRLKAYICYDARDSAIPDGPIRSAYEELIGAKEFAANDPGAPPLEFME